MKIIEIALFCSNTDAVKDFFKTILGNPISEWRGGATFRVGDVDILVHEKSSDGALPSTDHFAFGVKDLEAACKELEEKGIMPTYGPKTYDWGKSAYYFDPEGRMIEFHEL